MRLTAAAAIFATIVFCLFAAGAISLTPLWVGAALAGIAFGVAGAAARG